GRGPANAVSLADDSSVSRRHSQIVAQGNRFTLEDLGSANGTFINGQPLTGIHVLREGDAIAVGDTTLLFELKSAAPAPVRELPVSIPVATGETSIQPPVEIPGVITQPEQSAVAAAPDRVRAEPIGSRPSQLDRRWLVAGIVAALAIIVLIAIPSLNSPATAPAVKPRPTSEGSVATPSADSTEAPQPTDESQVTPAPESSFEPVSVSASDCTYGGLFKTIETVDDHTVRFVLCSPDPAFAFKLAYPSFGIQSARHLAASEGKPLDTPLGTGPYKLAGWSRGDQITLVANPEYWGEAPHMQTLVVRWNEQADARAVELQAGTVDGIDNPATDQIARLQSDSAVKVYWRAGLNTFMVGFSNNQAPFDNEMVRRAMAVGLDRAAIIE
ncbi:hypothetical protein GPROT1_03544, partial [Gammaproteobacteria bacterium]